LGCSLDFSFCFSSLGFSPFFPKNSLPMSLLNLMGFWKSFFGEETLVDLGLCLVCFSVGLA
jgi:hypothetical protein